MGYNRPPGSYSLARSACMAKSATIRSHRDLHPNAEAEAVLSELGLSPPQAIPLRDREIVRGRGIPFPPRLLVADPARDG